jgi:hypothetical protein
MGVPAMAADEPGQLMLGRERYEAVRIEQVASDAPRVEVASYDRGERLAIDPTDHGAPSAPAEVDGADDVRHLRGRRGCQAGAAPVGEVLLRRRKGT